MSTNLNNKANQIKEKFSSFFNNRTEEEKDKHDEYMLMASFLSEIEKVKKQKNIKQNVLAKGIGVSESYLTQVFRGTKPLNFNTISKIKKFLEIGFYVQVYYKNQLINNVFTNPSSDEVDLPKYQQMIDSTKYDTLSFYKELELKTVSSLTELEIN